MKNRKRTTNKKGHRVDHPARYLVLAIIAQAQTDLTAPIKDTHPHLLKCSIKAKRTAVEFFNSKLYKHWCEQIGIEKKFRSLDAMYQRGNETMSKSLLQQIRGLGQEPQGIRLGGGLGIRLAPGHNLTDSVFTIGCSREIVEPSATEMKVLRNVIQTAFSPFMIFQSVEIYSYRKPSKPEVEYKVIRLHVSMHPVKGFTAEENMTQEKLI